MSDAAWSCMHHVGACTMLPLCCRLALTHVGYVVVPCLAGLCRRERDAQFGLGNCVARHSRLRGARRHGLVTGLVTPFAMLALPMFSALLLSDTRISCCECPCSRLRRCLPSPWLRKYTLGRRCRRAPPFNAPRLSEGRHRQAFGDQAPQPPTPRPASNGRLRMRLFPAL